MKVAICFSGEVKSLNYTYLNLKNYLIDQCNADVFISVVNNKYSLMNEDYLKALNSKSLEIEEDKMFQIENIKHQIRHGNLQVYFQMLDSWKKSNNLRLKYEKENNVKYDAVIRTRLDIKLFNPINIEEINQYDLNNYIYVPDFHSFSVVQGAGINDRFAIGSSENITTYSNMINCVYKYIKQGHIIHSESTLYYHLKKQNIKTKLVPIRFTRVRNFGEEQDSHIRNDPSTWNEIERGFYG